MAIPIRSPLLALAWLVGSGLLGGCKDEPPPSLDEQLASQEGFWFAARPERPAIARQAELAQLGYSDGCEPGTAGRGVVWNDPKRAQPGFNLSSSGHGPEAQLFDMNGESVHRWSFAYDDLQGVPPMDHPSQKGWRRVRLRDDGSLLAIHGGLALIALDRDSQLQWVYPKRAHHDLQVMANGHIWTLIRHVRLIPEYSNQVPSVEEELVELDANGKERRRISLVDALRTSEFHGAATLRVADLDRVQRLTIDGIEALDVLHPNSVQVLDGGFAERLPAFAAGNVLICLRELNALVVVDPELARVVWYREGGWLAPHDARLLDSGNLLLFDNMGNDGFSQALEIDALTGRHAWAYRGIPAESLFSMFCGSARRLVNGNTLITESCAGRAFEVTPKREVVWEFRTPHRAGTDDSLVAVLFEVERIPTERCGWLADD